VTTPTIAWGADAYMFDRNGPVIAQFMDFALAQVISEYAAQGVPLPERQYWTMGREALDCQQAVLTVQSTALGLAGAPAEMTKCNGPRTLSFNFQVVRCVPTGSGRGRIPTPASIQESAVPPSVDLEIMIYGLPARFDVYQSGVIAGAFAVDADGGLHGAFGSYTVTL
jgi:hypothetical protein